jgi:hypothetical protein
MQDIARGNVTNLLLHYSHIESICLWRNQRVRPVNLYISLCIKHHLIAAGLNAYIYIQYWCIDGKYRMYVARPRNGGKTSFQGVFPFVSCRATYILCWPSIYQYCIYPEIKFAKKMLFNLIIKKITETLLIPQLFRQGAWLNNVIRLI